MQGHLWIKVPQKGTKWFDNDIIHWIHQARTLLFRQDHFLLYYTSTIAAFQFRIMDGAKNHGLLR